VSFAFATDEREMWMRRELLDSWSISSISDYMSMKRPASLWVKDSTIKNLGGISGLSS
jgi:hypothetical protein